MAYIVVENFSAGLDTRKHPLTARPGTLQTLKNAHISRGGEIEKRKKFASFASLPAGTFGMEAADNTIYVFGSATTPAGMPSGITYQRLQHPDSSPMTEVVYSALYGGYPFVLAKFADGKTYPFWNGTIIGDFVNGYTRASMAGSVGLSLGNVAGHMTGVINASNSGYTALHIGTYIDVTGPQGVEWTASATAESPIVVSTSVMQTPKAARPEQLASGGFSVTGGTTGRLAETTVRTLSSIDVLSMPGITGAFTRNPSAPNTWITLFTSSGLYYDWVQPPGTGGFGTPWYNSAQRLAYNIALFIRNNSGVSKFSANYGGLETSGASQTPGTFKVLSHGEYASQYNGWEAWLEFDATPSGVSGIAELIEPSTITTSPINPSKFFGRIGVMSGGNNNAIVSVKVDGVEILGSPVLWRVANTTTMEDVSVQISAYTSSVEYTSHVANGFLEIKGLAGSGSTINGRQISVTVSGDVTIGSVTGINGGLPAETATSQVNRYYFSGEFATGKKITLIATPTLDSSNPVYWGATNVTNTTPVSALTFKTKAHITSGSSLFFSGVNQVTKWGNNATGAGFINLSNNSGGNEVLTALALYQGQLAAFARRSIQLWGIDTDPINNRQGQVLSNTGTFAANSVVSIGEIDVFYLSDSGVRSLRARDASNSAVVNDVGTPVDGIILGELAAMAEVQKAACCAIIEPIDGRYWLAIGSKIYVYSYFPNSQVAAWSVYEPGFAITKFTTKDGRVYARAGNLIYLYGGTNNAEYDNSEVEVVLPYLDGGKPAHQKTLNGLDMTIEGSWRVFIGMDPVAINARDDCGTITQPTFSLGRVMANGTGTHVGIRMVNNSDGYARIANLIAHFEANESN